MIKIEEITKNGLERFWELHLEYLKRDIFPFDTDPDSNIEEDIAYFTGDGYRGTLEKYMTREPDRGHMIYFTRDGEKIGCAMYVTYKSEDGKCLICDYWIFPEFRGGGTGHACFTALKNYTEADGAKYYTLNVSKENSRRFWKSIGFAEYGKDEYDMPLMRLG